MHKSLLTIFLLFVTVLSGIGQNLSVKSLELAAMDLTAARQAVADLNGVPCALLKVQMLDRMAKAEGNIIRRVDNGTETWLYLTEGTKMVKIIGEKHKPLMVNISDWFPKGVERKLTYILELDSDLPPEVLLSTAKQEIQPVAMSAATAPLLPDWWNTAAESDLYVGIAPPTLDGKRAKTMALSNAIGMYANASRQPVSFIANCKSKSGASDWESIMMESNVKLAMDIEVLQEYYNHRGEYFVLCRIRDSKKEDPSVALIKWLATFEIIEGWGRGTMDMNMSMKLMLDGLELQGAASCSVDNEMNNISCNGVSFTLPADFEYTAERDKSEKGLFVSTANSIGAAQTHLLYSLPFVPDSLEISGATLQEGDNVSTETACMGYSAMLPHKPVMENIYQDGMAFSFPMDMAGLKPFTLPDKSYKKKWDKGVEEMNKKYLKEGYCFAGVFGIYGVSDKLERNTGFSSVPPLASIGSFVIIRAFANALNISSENAMKKQFSSSVENKIRLKNIIWELDASNALKQVNFDKISKHIVHIIRY